MPKRAARYNGDKMCLLERSRLAVMQYLARRFRPLFKALNEKEIDQLEMDVEDVLYAAFQDSKKFEETEGNRKSHEYTSRSSGVEAQFLHVHGPGSKYNLPPLLGKRGWQ